MQVEEKSRREVGILSVLGIFIRLSDVEGRNALTPANRRMVMGNEGH